MTKTKKMLAIEKKIGDDLFLFISREYTEKKRTLEDIADELGIARSSLANFMRRLSISIRTTQQSFYKDRIPPTKEELINLYSKKNMTMKDIGKIFGFDRGVIWKLCQNYNIPTLTHNQKLNGRWSLKYDKCISCGRTNVKYIGKGLCRTCHEYKRLGRELVKRVENIDDNEYQIILGSILGDATINKTTNSAFFEESHCVKQEEYLLWKKITAFSKFNVNICYKNNNSIVRIWTEVSPIFKKLREEFYPNGKKIITNEILNKLKPLGIAVWFMDDGSLNLRGGGDISTDCFTKEENIFIRDYFIRLGCNCKIYKRKTGTYKVIFNQEGFNNFVKLIEKYIHPIFYYKIDSSRRKKYYELEKLRKNNYYKKKSQSIYKAKIPNEYISLIEK